jgi:hypothetical protein
MNNTELKKIHIKTMENVTDEELTILVEGLKKIDGFEFTIDTFVKVNKIESVKSS